ncbi:MAG: PEP-CTERM sorting domain-containing protein [Verrucomicrobia bacterium]|nr:PEP-CTERM sorting domain-containing protein [Verrucomicrobiota bacterium]
MKELAPRVCSAIVLITLLAAHTTLASYIIEASDAAGRLGEGNFTYTGAGGTAASYGNASGGQLPATSDSPATFFTLRHAYGGDTLAPNLDQYTFTYSPISDADNTVFAENTDFNLPQNLQSTGLSGGDAGIYNVYRIHPANPNVSGGLTTYDVFVNGGLEITESINQNATNSVTGANIGRWELLGSVGLTNNTDTVAVTMTPETTGFVSMRASGIMFEYVAPIPEPTVLAMLGFGFALVWARRRLMP